MKSSMILAGALACALALTACGGGGDSGSDGEPPALSRRADEGIWSNTTTAEYRRDGFLLQSVILRDGSYWGAVSMNGVCVHSVLNGVAQIDEVKVSGKYTDTWNYYENGTYSGTVSAGSKIDVTFGPENAWNLLPEGLNSLAYDDVYNQPISLSEISGDYINRIYDRCSDFTIGIPSPAPSIGYANALSPRISGSKIVLVDIQGSEVAEGVLMPREAGVSVFDLSLITTTTIPYAPMGTVFKGILFQTSSGRKDNEIEIIARSKDSAYFFIGQKQK